VTRSAVVRSLDFARDDIANLAVPEVAVCTRPLCSRCSRRTFPGPRTVTSSADYLRRSREELKWAAPPPPIYLVGGLETAAPYPLFAFGRRWAFP
jgi:hypothetical protein